jgi:hypothetical protein
MTEAQKQSLIEYKLKPLIFNAEQALEQGVIKFNEDGAAQIQLNGETVTIPNKNQYDLVLPTIFGLNEALVQADSGKSFRNLFDDEYSKFNSIFDRFGNIKTYGNYVYYPDREHLVQFAPPYWHRLSLLASNAELIKDPDFKMNWQQVTDVFHNSKPAIAGASVGSKIADTLMKVLRPAEMTIADPAVYKLTNANRTDIQYDDLVYSIGLQEKLANMGDFIPHGMKNKSISFALKTQKIDPYATIYPFQRGVTLGNVTDFVSGAGVVVEEVDMSYDMEIKVAIRNEARNQKKLFCMVSDLGSWVQWDIRPFHLNSEIPLFLNYTDEQIFSLNKEARESKENFFAFMEGLIEKYFWESGEFGSTLSGKLPRIVGSMPQLGSTTSVAAGIGAEFISRILLGHKNIFERGIIDLKKQEIRTYGKMIGDL